jgi:hypothetical protein
MEKAGAGSALDRAGTFLAGIRQALDRPAESAVARTA